MGDDARPAEKMIRGRVSESPSAAMGLSQAQTSDRIDERLHADDVVHQSLGNRLLHGRHSELALGVLGVKDHRSPADAYNFRGIQRALSPRCPLHPASLALRHAS